MCGEFDRRRPVDVVCTPRRTAAAANFVLVEESRPKCMFAVYRREAVADRRPIIADIASQGLGGTILPGLQGAHPGNRLAQSIPAFKMHISREGQHGYSARQRERPASNGRRTT